MKSVFFIKNFPRVKGKCNCSADVEGLEVRKQSEDE